MRWSKAPGPLQGAEFSETSCNKLSTINNWNIKKKKTKPQDTTANTIEDKKQYPYRAYPPAKGTDSKLRKVKRETQHPRPTISIVLYPPKQSQRN
jgi:hypothetical protein